MNRWRGLGGASNLPVPPGPVRGHCTGSATKPSSGGSASNATTASQIIPVHVLDAFYQTLPNPAIQQISWAHELPYNPAVMAASPSGASLKQPVFQVPGTEVYVITDVYFYALAPGQGLQSPPVQYSQYQISGMLQFNLLIDDRAPMRLEGAPAHAYPVNPNPNSYPTQSGWNQLNTTFGAQRTAAFAVYAKGSQYVAVEAKRLTPSQSPRFLITRLGVTVTAFSLPQTRFERVFLRTSQTR